MSTTPHVIALGHGRYVVTRGSFHGVPSLYLEPVDQAGAIGELASDGTVPDHDVLPGATVITFANEESVLVVGEALIALQREMVSP